jgi:hypothetical protein
MQTHNDILINNSIGVNSFKQIFLDLVNKEDDKDRKELEHRRTFDKIFNLAPEIHHTYIKHIVETQFKDSVEDYIKTIPLFFEKFTRKDKDICDGNAKGETKLQTRRMNKRKKELLLYSAQLLKLIGGKCKHFRSSILCNSLVSFYKSEMKKTEEYVNNFKLVRANGRVLRLTKHEDKQKQKVAQIIRISKCLSDLAVKKLYTYSLITLTLPPVFHPNPTKGDCSYNGATPKEAHQKLMKYWSLIRANFAKNGLITGDDFFGLQTCESQKDSTLHLHCLIYHSSDNTNLIHSIVTKVQDRQNKKAKHKTEKVFFDIKLNDGRASGSTYVFKYITKTNAIYTEQDDNAIKNTACRYMYGARGFAFFGVDNAISQFNFLHDNYLSFKKYLNDEIIRMLEDRDYFLFITKYSKFFENVYYYNDNGAKKLLGVTFNMEGNSDFTEAYKKNTLNIKGLFAPQSTQVFIEKRQYTIFENDSENLDSIHQLDLSDIKNIGASIAFDLVKAKQANYDIRKEKFIEECEERNIFTFETEEEVLPFHLLKPKSTAEDREEEKQSHKVEQVTLIQPYSRKSNPEKPKPVLADKPTPKIEIKTAEKIKYLGFSLVR